MLYCWMFILVLKKLKKKVQLTNFLTDCCKKFIFRLDPPHHQKGWAQLQQIVSIKTCPGYRHQHMFVSMETTQALLFWTLIYPC